MNRLRGLTISEVVISTAVIGTATVVAIPKFLNATQRAKESALKYELKTLRKAVDQFYVDNGGYPDEIVDLIGEKPPRALWLNGQETKWTSKIKWHGPYLGYGDGSPTAPNDPVSLIPFLVKRAESGRLQIFSSAKGQDSEGKSFTEY